MATCKYITLLFASIVPISCSSPKDGALLPEGAETRGVMQIEVTERSAEEEDRIETARFIVFKNVPSTPELELNELFSLPSSTPTEDEVSQFKITLEVSRKLSGTSDKMVVVIVNEPSTLTATLNGVASYGELENIELRFDEFLNAGHTALISGKTMPMTAVIWTRKVYPTAQEAENDTEKISLRRAAARVDIYMRKEASQDFDIGVGTKLILNNTYDREYLVRDQHGENIFGRIMTVSSGFLTRTVVLTNSDTREIPSANGNNPGNLIARFYTPERTCSAAGDTDKLVLDIDLVTSEGATRTGKVVFDRFTHNGTQTDINVITRNNSYSVSTTIGANSVTASIIDWNNEDIETEF